MEDGSATIIVEGLDYKKRLVDGIHQFVEEDNYMRNIIVPISAFIFGFIFAVSLSPALAQIFVNSEGLEVEKIMDYQDIYSQKFATSTFNSLADYEETKRNFDYQRELFNRLDKIIWLLENN